MVGGALAMASGLPGNTLSMRLGSERSYRLGLGGSPYVFLASDELALDVIDHRERSTPTNSAEVSFVTENTNSTINWPSGSFEDILTPLHAFRLLSKLFLQAWPLDNPP